MKLDIFFSSLLLLDALNAHNDGDGCRDNGGGVGGGGLFIYFIV